MNFSEEEVNDEIEQTRFGGDIHPQQLVKRSDRLSERKLDDGDKFQEWGYEPPGDDGEGVEADFDSGSDGDAEFVAPGSTLTERFNEHYGGERA